MHVIQSAIAILASIALAGCYLGSEPQRARTGNAWADCYRRFEPTSDTTADLTTLGQACAAPAGMQPIALHQGSDQREGDAPERLSFRARRGCYRAIAVGGPGVLDLDVAVYDPQGQLAGGDLSRDRWPIVPPRGPLCVEADGVYTVAVSVARGEGDFVLQIWGRE